MSNLVSACMSCNISRNNKTRASRSFDEQKTPHQKGNVRLGRSSTGSEKEEGTGGKPIAPEAIRLAELLDQSIETNLPNRRQPSEGHIERWAADIEKLHRLDGKDWQTIENVLAFSQRDSFWSANIQSGETFRRQWDKLVAKMTTSANGTRQEQNKLDLAMERGRGFVERGKDEQD